jgi:hypothetical protein
MKSLILLLAVILGLFLLAGIAKADTIDLWDSFPDTLGQNHFFALSLPWNNTGEGSYIQMDDLGSYMWGTLNESVAHVPYIFRESDPWIEMYPSSNGGVNGTGLDFANPIYTYVVPTNGAGTYNITGAFQKAGTGDTYVFVKHNQNFLWNHTFSLSDANGTQASFNIPNEQFSVDDKLYYGVGCGGSKNNVGDLVYLTGQINAVPEPISCVLFFVGGGVLLAARRFK